MIKSKKGFTLIELIVVIALSSIILAIIIGFFVNSSRVYTRENSRAALQQDVRAALDIMARDIRMAGYDPQKTGDFGYEVTNATHFRFNMDLNEDGALDSSPSFPDCENLAYQYSLANGSIQIICGGGTGSPDTQTLIGDTETQITSLLFDYKDEDNNSTSVDDDIRAVDITIEAEISAGQSGVESRTYSSTVSIRNAGPNAN